MKTIEDIDKQIAGIKWFIDSHKKQIGFYWSEDFNPKKIKEYADKIERLNIELELLLWVKGGKND